VPEILRFSDAVSLAFHAMAYLAQTPDEHHTVGHIAGLIQCSEAHLSKVMQRLHRTGLVSSTRGPKGGYRLEGPASAITLLIVYEVVEGPLDEMECLLETPVCRPGACVLGDLLVRVNRQINDYLSQTKLSDLSNVYDTAEACAKCKRHAS
jgi:Rrf2 family transcriptional regulator, nitric oxide-sensitive transcriptional repressor